MKWTITRQLLTMSKYSIFGIFIQCLAFNLIMANNSLGQIKSMDEIYLSFKAQNIDLKAMFQKIEIETNFEFIYFKSAVNEKMKVDFVFHEESLGNILRKVSSVANVKFKRVNDKIYVNRKDGSTYDVQEVIDPAQTRNITGKVTSQDDGESIPGVNVIEKGTSNGTVTDIGGAYSLQVSEGATLVFSSVGYLTQEILIGTSSVIDLSLVSDIRTLEELVVVGYGIQEKMNITGSITQVNTAEIPFVPMPSLSQGLMGRAPGVFIKNKKGQPGEDGVDINIRGFGNPLIIVDGMPVSKTFFEQLEPGDIESFNILKDASAAAVYGARAGNGVILVTTKRGTSSSPQFSYSGNYALQYFTNVPDFVGSPEYASMQNLALVYFEGLPAAYSSEEIQKFRDGSDPIKYPNTDWWGITLRNYAPQQQHSLSVRGGTDMVKYYTSLSYFNQKGMHVSNDLDYNRFTLRSNIDVKLTNKLSLGFDLSATNQDYIGPSVKMERTSIDGYMLRLFRQLPNEPFITLPDPTKVPAVRSGSTISPYHLGFIDHVGFHEWNRLFGFAKLSFDYELPLGFGAKAVFDVNRTYHTDKVRALTMPQYDYFPETGEYRVARLLRAFDYLEETNRTTKNLNQQYLLTWNKTLNNHQIDALFVHELLADNFNYVMASRRDFEFNLNFLNAGPDVNKDNAGYATEGGRKAYISRLNYNYDGKYLFEFSSRWDGSPKFPADKRWGFFPSASVGWRISEESFLADNIPVLSNLKVRASHGKLGYDAAGAFQYLSTFSIRSRIITDDQLEPGIRADALPNPNITWEKMTITNTGLDFALGRFLEGSIDYFYRLRTDVLGTRIGAVPDVVGATLPQENFYEFDNRGWEFSLLHKNDIGELRYSLGGNISTNREKTVFRDQAEFATMEAYRRGNQVGEWTDRFWAYPTDGLFHSQEEIDNWADIDGQKNRTIKPGDIKYIDYNGDGRITPEDMILAGRGTMPRLMFGMDLSLAWKGFDLVALFQGAGLYNYNLRAGGRDFIMPFYALNTPNTYMLQNMYVPENPWLPTHTTNAIWPRYGTDVSNRTHPNFSRDNTLWLVDGRYLRLKNLKLGYTIPQRISQRVNISNLQIYVSGYNILTFTKYPFVDPEADTSPARTFGDYHPPLGTYNFGLQMNF